MFSGIYPTKSSMLVPGAMLLFLCSGLMQACQFSKKAARRLYDTASKEQFDAIIVPGVPFENAVWSETMKARVYWAKHLYDQGITKNIIFSGGAVYSPYTEAEIMALYAEALGVPRKNIFTESKAEHSTENVYYSYQVAKRLGFTRIALASDPFQTKMLRKFSRKRVDGDIRLIPFVIDTLKKMEPMMTNPQINYKKAYVPGFVSIRQREGFWKRLKGTMGKSIDKEAYK